MPRRGVLLWPNTIAIIITVASPVMFLLLHKPALPFAFGQTGSDEDLEF